MISMLNKVKRKRLLSLMTAIVLFIMVLVGCSSKQEKAVDTGTSQSTAPTSEAAKALEPYEISWYVLAGAQQRDIELIQDEANKYLKDKINATLKINILDWGTYQDKMKVMIAGGESFDIAFTAAWWNDYIGNAKKGAFIPLNDLIDKYAPKTKAILGDEFLKASQIDGKNYAIPANKEKARHIGIVYNKTLADKYGFDMTTVKDFASLEPMLKTIKEQEKDVVPLQALGDPTQFIEWNVESIKDVGSLHPDGKYYNQYEKPEFKDAYDLARKFYLAGYYRKDAATERDHDAQIKAGKFFAYILNLKPGYVDEGNTANKQAGFQSGQLDITKPMMTNSDTMGSMMAISKTSKNPERAMMFLELFNSDKYLNNLINYGIEDKHYKKISDNVIEPIADSGYNVDMSWMFGNQLLSYLKPTENPDKAQMYENYNKAAIPALDLGFIFDNDSVESEVVATNSTIDEFHKALSVGAVDPAVYLPKFIQKLKDSGADKIVAEKQKQYDAWKAKK